MNQSTGIATLLQEARSVVPLLQQLPNTTRQQLVCDIAAALLLHTHDIVQANTKDLAQMEPANPLYDRLQLTAERIAGIAAATLAVANLPDPAGRTLSAYTHPRGMYIEKITVPLGVVGAIYEARPNVTVDISVLCLRSGNAVVLKGGSDARHTNDFLCTLMGDVLQRHGLPRAAITLLPPQREVVAELLTATRWVDVLIPRGSQSLIDFVRHNATVPVIETGAGVCHTYVHASANLHMAAEIVVNAKTQRPSVCNALDTVLVDAAIARDFLPLLLPGFTPFNTGIYADAQAFGILDPLGYPHVYPAAEDDFGREFLSQNCSVKVVQGLAEALNHISRYSSRHSEAIVCEDPAVADIFLQTVDAAAVYHNASTRFTDGGEFGLGAELGISTQKLHARGPFALEKLVCEKWIIRGNGQTR